MTNATPYHESVRALSDRIVAAQKPIRILEAVKWDASIQQRFFEQQCRELPCVDSSYYAGRQLDYDVTAKDAELAEIQSDILKQLGRMNPVGQMMTNICEEYRLVLKMLAGRGTPVFADASRHLYGAATDALHPGEPSLALLGKQLDETIGRLDEADLLNPPPKDIDSATAVIMLQEWLDAKLPGPPGSIRVKMDDGIVADAAAGADYLKLRQDAMFSERDLRLLEAHEGWVHLGTTWNGSLQPVCSFLAKGPPSSTVTQEGLAIFTEIVSMRASPSRVRRIGNRIRAVALAEQGADFLEVFHALEDSVPDAEARYIATMRVFRGSTPTGGPFTKDLSYGKGFVMIYNYLRLAVKNALLDRIPLLFCGKMRLEDIRILAQLEEEGMVERPAFLPPPFADLSALTAWMCYSNFLNKLDLKQVEADYAEIL